MLFRWFCLVWAQQKVSCLARLLRLSSCKRALNTVTVLICPIRYDWIFQYFFEIFTMLVNCSARFGRTIRIAESARIRWKSRRNGKTSNPRKSRSKSSFSPASSSEEDRILQAPRTDWLLRRRGHNPSAGTLYRSNRVTVRNRRLATPTQAPKIDQLHWKSFQVPVLREGYLRGHLETHKTTVYICKVYGMPRGSLQAHGPTWCQWIRHQI